MGPIWWSDEILDKRDVHVLRGGGANGLVAYCEGTD